MSKSSNVVMLVEDDDIDAMALETAIELYSSDVKTVRARNGEDALQRLASTSPQLVLMDIRMPKMDGREALSKIKSDESLKSTPVVMMSTSDDMDDVEYCYRHNCNAYVVKPIGFDMSRDVVGHILNFWLKTAIQ